MSGTFALQSQRVNASGATGPAGSARIARELQPRPEGSAGLSALGPRRGVARWAPPHRLGGQPHSEPSRPHVGLGLRAPFASWL